VTLRWADQLRRPVCMSCTVRIRAKNTKGRPAYYGKLLALSSLVRSVANVCRPVEVIFLNDRPITDDRLRVTRRPGEVVALPGAHGIDIDLMRR
jgi:hypothetical protein